MPDIKYLELLSDRFPNILSASAELINLNAIRALPKGTEYFLSDLHGEHEAFVLFDGRIKPSACVFYDIQNLIKGSLLNHLMN